MREIKYRVWDTHTNRMSLVANISFGDDGSAQTIMVELAPKGQYSNAIVHGESGILMQYTGMKDRNGKDIYEGDIVTIDTGLEVLKTSVIEFNQGCFVARSLTSEKYCAIAQWATWGEKVDYIDIIGNIYEHPHLVAKEQKK